MLILGIETSCDETAAAVVEDGKTILSDVVASQIAVHSPYGGVVPELASRKHVESILVVMEQALERAGLKARQVDAIAVTRGPGLTGALLVGLNYALSLILPRGVVDLLLVTALTVVTGILHLDGLADVCDGLAARGDRERFLKVLKDSQIGAAGAIGLVLALLLKYTALLLIPAGMKLQALFCVPLLARFAQVAMIVGARRARSDGLGSVFISGAGWPQLLLATMTTLAATLLFLGIQGLWIFIAACLLTALLKAWFQRKIGGITGDIIGFASELNEILTLLMILAFTGKQVFTL
ncbi:MAG: adenosylcobinamide-GDP ribazoletransferase [Syntrophobacteraceae bacterium]|nr:adenosylcobinamide-GDP ribazoletransferase [Syntrophobacteraceae bacterium]